MKNQTMDGELLIDVLSSDLSSSNEQTQLKHSLMTETVMVNSASLVNQQVNLKEILQVIELNFIKEALNISNGIVSHAAEKLGLRRTTLIEKMRKYKVEK